MKHLIVNRLMNTYRTAAFRRLCVETLEKETRKKKQKSAAFRRLCVETCFAKMLLAYCTASRLQAAVC